MTDNDSKENQVVCALGLDPEKVWTEFSKIDVVLENTNKIVKRLDEQNGRIRSNEVKIAIVMSASGVVIAVLTILKLMGHL